MIGWGLFCDVTSPLHLDYLFIKAQQGVSVDWEDREVGDLAFFKNKGSKITHVGILMNDDQIIHASGEVRKDGITHEGIIHSKTGEKTHEFSHIRRMEF